MATIKDNLMDLFELDKMEPAKAAEMVDRLAKLVFQGVLVRVLPLLEEKDLAEYERIVDSNEGGEKLFAFLAEKIPGFEQIVAEEAESLRAEMAGEMQSAGMLEK
jgi:hypothetical protein